MSNEGCWEVPERRSPSEGLTLAMRAFQRVWLGAASKRPGPELVKVSLFQVWGSLPTDQVWSGALARQKPEHYECVTRDLRLMRAEGNYWMAVRASRNQKEAGGQAGGEQEEAGSLEDDSKPCHGGAGATKVPEPWGGGTGPPVVPTVP